MAINSRNDGGNRARSQPPGHPALSVVITVHNEGDELRRTIASVRHNTANLAEILVVDDGSDDGCCDGCESRGVRVIRHRTRRGVARSRREAGRRALGDAIAFLDAHQRVGKGSLDACAELALARRAIVWPDVCGFGRNDARAHGAFFTLSRTAPPFGAQWKERQPRNPVAPISALRAPGYVIPRAIYPKVEWISRLAGWGGSEAAVSLKAFFAGIDILHLCGPLVRHRFKKTFTYEVGWGDVWRNHALIARVCFDESTWYDYWLPRVFDRHLSAAARRELESDAIRNERQAFSRIKVRSDRQFWTDLVFRDPPAELR